MASVNKSLSHKFSTSRLEAFSDGVFAIAITLLVLEIAIPANAEENLLRGLLDQWPVYLAYVVSFATIGAVWFAHSAITEFLDKSDRGLARLNLLLLMAVSFLPYPTKLLAEFIEKSGPERVAVTLYGAILLLISTLLSLLWQYAVRHKLLHKDAQKEDVELISQRLQPGLIGYVVLIGLGLFLPVIAVIGYLLIPILILFPTRSEK